jgi:hypothetical protein
MRDTLNGTLEEQSGRGHQLLASRLSGTSDDCFRSDINFVMNLCMCEGAVLMWTLGLCSLMCAFHWCVVVRLKSGKRKKLVNVRIQAR